MENVTWRLSEFIARLTYDQISAEAISKVKSCLLDSLGCALLGAGTKWGKIVNGFVQNQGGTPEARLWTSQFLGPAANVVLGNGTLIHSFDFDDYHMTKIHPGSVVIPAALAIGEKEHADGKTLIAAIVAGYETMIHISRGLNPAASRLKGWHLTGTCGTFAAAAAVGSICRFDTKTMASALGLAGTQSSGLWAFTADGSYSKRLHPGRAAQSGLIGASLAQMGYHGPTQILEAEDGGFFGATSYDFDFSKVTDGLGEKFDTEDVVIKPYAACGSLHSTIDAALFLRNKKKIGVEDISEINVYNSEVVNVQCGFEYKPMGVLQAQMSLKYCVARVLIDGELSQAQFSDHKLSDPQAIELASHVNFILDEEINRIYPREFPSIVEIIMKDGKKTMTRVDAPKGSVMHPMSWTEVQDKFKSMGTQVIGEGQAKALVESIEELEDVSDVSKISELMMA